MIASGRNKVVLSPYTSDDCAIFAVKNAGPFEHVIVELAFDELPIRKHKYPIAFFEVLDKIT